MFTNAPRQHPLPGPRDEQYPWMSHSQATELQVHISSQPPGAGGRASKDLCLYSPGGPQCLLWRCLLPVMASLTICSVNFPERLLGKVVYERFGEQEETGIPDLDVGAWATLPQALLSAKGRGSRLRWHCLMKIEASGIPHCPHNLLKQETLPAVFLPPSPTFSRRNPKKVIPEDDRDPGKIQKLL